MDEYFYIYIITNKHNTVLYTGQSSSLSGRIFQHQNALTDGFSKRYNLGKLVYYECAEDRDSALFREKQIKGYSRRKKDALIESMNPEWKDLSGRIIE